MLLSMCQALKVGIRYLCTCVYIEEHEHFFTVFIKNSDSQYNRNYFAVEMATLTRKDNKTIIRVLTSPEVEKLIAAFEKSEAEAEAAKKQPPKS